MLRSFTSMTLVTLVATLGGAPWGRAAALVPVANDLVLAYDGSSATTGATFIWHDQALGGGTHNATQGTAAQQPTVLSGALNGQNALLFNGVASPGPGDDVLSTTFVPNSAGVSMFAVFRRDTQTSGGSCCRPIVAAGTLEQAGIYVDSQELVPDAVRARYNNVIVNGSGVNNTNYHIATLTATTGTNNIRLFRDGSLQGQTTTATAPTLTAVEIGGQSGSPVRYFSGAIAEVLVYDAALNEAQRTIVDNYLSAKYDIPLTAGDFYEGDGAPQGHYDLDVIGIGRAANASHVSSGNSGLTLTAAGGSLNANGEFVLAGHKTPVNGLTTSDAPADSLRWERVWYVDANDGGVDVEFTFDFSEAGLMAGGTNFQLLYRATEGPFDFQFVGGAPLSLVDDQVTFLLPAGLLANGYYTLSFQAVVPEPSSLGLLGLGAFALAARARRRGSRVARDAGAR